MPPIMEENVEATNIYIRVRNQVVTAGMGQIIDLHFPSVQFVMDLYDVKNKKNCFERVLKIFHHFLSESKIGSNSK